MLRNLLLLAMTLTIAASAQMPPGYDPPRHGELPLLAPNLSRTEGIDAASGIAYTRLFVSAKSAPATTTDTLDLAQPTLTAQCTKDPSGLFHFDLYVNFGEMADPAFYPPWKPTKERPNPAKTTYVTLKTEFRGYTSQSLKLEFAMDWRPERQLRFNHPGLHSANLEPLTSIMQRLSALPTLTISDDKHLAVFDTAPLLARLRTEPLCKADGL